MWTTDAGDAFGEAWTARLGGGGGYREEAVGMSCCRDGSGSTAGCPGGHSSGDGADNSGVHCVIMMGWGCTRGCCGCVLVVADDKCDISVTCMQLILTKYSQLVHPDALNVTGCDLCIDVKEGQGCDCVMNGWTMWVNMIGAIK